MIHPQYNYRWLLRYCHRHPIVSLVGKAFLQFLLLLFFCSFLLFHWMEPSFSSLMVPAFSSPRSSMISSWAREELMPSSSLLVVSYLLAYHTVCVSHTSSDTPSTVKEWLPLPPHGQTWYSTVLCLSYSVFHTSTSNIVILTEERHSFTKRGGCCCVKWRGRLLDAICHNK